MKMTIESCKLIGWEDKVSSKGRAYTIVLLGQGVDTMKIMLARDVDPSILIEDELYNVYVQTRKFGKEIEFEMLDMVVVS